MEKPSAKGSNNFVVGLFVLIALLVGAGFVVFMGGSSIFGRETAVYSKFEDVRGLNIGAPVFVSGIQVGRVAEISFPETNEPGANSPQIRVKANIFSQFRGRIRKDSEASITTQGVLGDKVLDISPGTSAAEVINENEVIASKKEKELSDYFARGASVVDEVSELARNLNILIKDLNGSGKVKSIVSRLETATQNLSQSSKDDIAPAMKSLRNILSKVEKGEGTLGALVNDSSLHEDMRVLLGGAQRSTVVRFLVRQAISNKEKEAQAQSPKK